MKKFLWVALIALLSAAGCKKEKTDTKKVLSISPSEVELLSGQEEDLRAFWGESLLSKKDVQWSSDNTNIVSVSEEGVLKASPVNDGDAVITARYKKNEATCKVKVIIPVQIFGFVSSLQSKSLAVDEEFTWSVIYMPTYATYHDVTFENSDPSVAELTQDTENPMKFTIKARKLGTTTITAKCGGKEEQMFIYVDAVKATKVTVNPTSVNLECMESTLLTATVEPENATNKTVSWTSSNPEMVEVSKQGAIRGRRAGTATVSAHCGDQVASCTVTVAMPEGAVDLGLSVYWAECNLGASTEFDFGNYYSWGELRTKDYYSWDTYKFLEKKGKTQQGVGETGYVFSRYGSDNKKNFSDYDYEDDVAFQTLGGLWRTPTSEQFKELRRNCTVVYEGDGVRFYSNVPGYIGKSLYFPESGWMDEDELWTYIGHRWDRYPFDTEWENYGVLAIFWTPVICRQTAYAVCYSLFDPKPEDYGYDPSLRYPFCGEFCLQRYFGATIRPVW